MKSSILFCAAVLLFASSCKKIHADGPTVTETRDHRGFTAIASDVDATIIFSQAADYSIEISAQQDLLNHMESKVTQGELGFYYPVKVNIGRHDPVTIHITAPEVRGFEINGSGELRGGTLQAADHPVRLKINGSGSMHFTRLTAGAVDAEVVGSGKMNLANGRVSTAAYHISGSGDIDAGSVDADKVSARISGSGTIRASARASLDAEISGSGQVYYRGTPRVSSNISGSGKVRPY